MNSNELYEYLDAAIEGAMSFRMKAAARYPDDDRNARSLEALEKLHAGLKGIPSDHPSITAIRDANYVGPTSSADSVARSEECFLHENYFILHYGFHMPRSGDAEEFLWELADLLESAVKPLNARQNAVQSRIGVRHQHP